MKNLPLAQEVVPDDEPQVIEELVQRLSKKIVDEKTGNIIRRDAHPKMHGLVKAEFTVNPNLPPYLATGLFAQPATYPAWVRFSNQDAARQADKVRDVRGMAIKLLKVPGKKLLEGEENATTHDFITISAPRMVTADAREFLDLLKAFTAGIFSKGLFCLTHVKTTVTLLTTFKTYANPLLVRYWSTTPYLLGEGVAVKYSAIPSHVLPPDDDKTQSDDYLRDAMIGTLSEQDVYFDFCVQLQTDALSMPIENANVVWSEDLSPFHKVATIRIPRQVFATPERDQYGENLSFNPWHALPEHRPLGGINRARRVVYAAISKFRHEKNGVVRKEPEDFDIE